MPVISRFNGIIIKMYFQQAEHNPPHIHATHGEKVAAIGIDSGEILDGELPLKDLALVQQWIGQHKNDLI